MLWNGWKTKEKNMQSVVSVQLFLSQSSAWVDIKLINPHFFLHSNWREWEISYIQSWSLNSWKLFGCSLRRRTHFYWKETLLLIYGGVQISRTLWLYRTNTLELNSNIQIGKFSQQIYTTMMLMCMKTCCAVILLTGWLAGCFFELFIFFHQTFEKMSRLDCRTKTKPF